MATRPNTGSSAKFERLRTLLREMFQLDRGDLDFGLYRIMNLKSAEITDFLDYDLLPQIQEQLKPRKSHFRNGSDYRRTVSPANWSALDLRRSA